MAVSQLEAFAEAVNKKNEASVTKETQRNWFVTTCSNAQDRMRFNSAGHGTPEAQVSFLVVCSCQPAANRKTSCRL